MVEPKMIYPPQHLLENLQSELNQQGHESAAKAMRAHREAEARFMSRALFRLTGEEAPSEARDMPDYKARHKLEDITFYFNGRKGVVFKGGACIGYYYSETEDSFRLTINYGRANYRQKGSTDE